MPENLPMTRALSVTFVALGFLSFSYALNADISSSSVAFKPFTAFKCLPSTTASLKFLNRVDQRRNLPPKQELPLEPNSVSWGEKHRQQETQFLSRSLKKATTLYITFVNQLEIGFSLPIIEFRNGYTFWINVFKTCFEDLLLLGCPLSNQFPEFFFGSDSRALDRTIRKNVSSKNKPLKT